MQIATDYCVVPVTWDAFHELHCASCFMGCCNFADGTECAMINCPGCGVRMHACKLAEHRECICARTLITCPNAYYGCSARMHRHKINEHIQHCPASLILCPFVRNRQFVSKQAKKMFKRIAKGHRNGPPLMDDDDAADQSAADHCCPPDIALARIDQRTLRQAFCISRAKRLALAHVLHRRELEQLLENNKDDGCSGGDEAGGDNYTKKRANILMAPPEEQADSSDEEAKITAKHYRAMREPFSGCRLCAIDPGSQHLHQLGSLRLNGVDQQTGHHDQDGKVADHCSSTETSAERTEPDAVDPFAFLPIFSRQHSLFISTGIDSDATELVLFRERCFMRTNFPIFACDEFVRRDQFADHCCDHLTFEDDGFAFGHAFFGRCPNAQYGCQFSTDKLLKAVDGGQIKFNPFLGLTVHVPMPLSQCPPPLPPPSTADGCNTTTRRRTLAELSNHFFTLLGPFLDDASLRSLSSSCRRFRHLLPALLRDRLSVELRWAPQQQQPNGTDGGKATRRHYGICGTRRFFGTSQHGATAGVCAVVTPAAAARPRVQIEPRGALIDHLRDGCKFSNQHSIYDHVWLAGHKRTVDALCGINDVAK
ncbi:hypothetical protein niasHT_022964 [Heterodera trifolii]|uniref:TRAF-type domain-containing protein n=1 Tax=Heterodera trifolii TaxID=157864 RepID=A0ABD2KP34_9BILA